LLLLLVYAEADIVVVHLGPVLFFVLLYMFFLATLPGLALAQALGLIDAIEM